MSIRERLHFTLVHLAITELDFKKIEEDVVKQKQNEAIKCISRGKKGGGRVHMP